MMLSTRRPLALRGELFWSGTEARRGFVLIAVLVVVGSAILLTTSMLLLSQAQHATTARSADAVQSRLLAWSGAQAVMAVLDEQREAILAGRQPRADRQYLIYETPGELGIVRLLPTGPGGKGSPIPFGSGLGRPALLGPEAGKLDLNLVDAEALASTGFVDGDVASKIIEYRESAGGFQSVGELLRVPGVTAEMVWGPLEDLTPMDDAMNEGSDLAQRILSLHEQPSPRGLADIVTVFAFEPNIQRSGRLRINLNVKWSEELAHRVQDRFGADAAQGLQRIFESGTTFDSERKIIEVLRAFKVEPKDWPEILDAFTTEQGEYVAGRLDINTASYDALIALASRDDEGGGTSGEAGGAPRSLLQPDQAAQIVRVRDELPPEQRATIAWPAIHGIIPAEAYDHLAGRITTRCWTYRVRLAAGTVPGDEPDAPLQRPVIYEAVIDLSAPTPRLAEFRDITLMQTAAALAAFAPPDEELLVSGSDVPALIDASSVIDQALDEEGRPIGTDSLLSVSEFGESPVTGLESDGLAETDDDAEPAAEQDQSAEDAAAEAAGGSPTVPDPRRGRWRLPG